MRNAKRLRCLLKWTAAVGSIVVVLKLLSSSSSVGDATSSSPDADADWGDDVAVRLRSDGKQREYIDNRGLHVIVGRYKGGDEPGAGADVPDDLLDTNDFKPDPKQGAMGEPVVIGPLEQSRARTLQRIHRFNLLASDRIPLNRTLPDIRKDACKRLDFDVERLPTTSVVIVFHNEAWSTLMRTVQSVVDRSPRRLIREILLVDDASQRTYLKSALDEAVAELPVPVRVLRSTERIGLVRARLMGAAQATGEVLTFLDAHCETTTGWLEPLLHRVREDRTVAVCPIIDIISDESFALLRSFELHHGGISWRLHFRWLAASQLLMAERRANMTAPFRTPVMAGGLFAISRSYFEEIGTYDDQMDIWGGENLEISFRIWQCGGRVETSPCSHVAHVFRKSSPYTFPGGVDRVLYANLARVALVWMDDWKDFYFKLNPEADRLRDSQTVRSRLALRQRLQCRSFDWYLKNVWPENSFPAPDRFFGKVVHKATDQCLERPASGSQATARLRLTRCANPKPADVHLWVATWNTTLRDGTSNAGTLMGDESMCLDQTDGEARIMACSSGLGRQRWTHNGRSLELRHVDSGRCLDVARPPETAGLAVHPCDGSAGQQWRLESHPWRNQ